MILKPVSRRDVLKGMGALAAYGAVRAIVPAQLLLPRQQVSQRHIYVGQFQWVKDDSANPFAGNVWRAPLPDECIGLIDMRGTGRTAPPKPQGYGIFVYPRKLTALEESANGLTYLGDDPTAPVANRVNVAFQTWANLPSIPLGGTLMQILWYIRTRLGDPRYKAQGLSPLAPKKTASGLEISLSMPGFPKATLRDVISSRNHPLWPSLLDRLQHDYRISRLRAVNLYGGTRLEFAHRRMLTHLMKLYGESDYKIFIPSDLPDEGPVALQTTRTDDFGGETGSVLLSAHTASDGDWGWTEVIADLEVEADGKAHANGDNNSQYNCDASGTLSNEEQTLQVDVATDDSANRGEWVLQYRHNGLTGASEDCYFIRMSPGIAADLKLFRRDDGVDTGLVAQAASVSVLPYTSKVSCDTSGNHQVFIGSNLEHTETGENSFTANFFHSLGHTFAWGDDLEFDNYSARDSAAAAPQRRIIFIG